jgi:hypothetical protein
MTERPVAGLQATFTDFSLVTVCNDVRLCLQRVPQGLALHQAGQADRQVPCVVMVRVQGRSCGHGHCGTDTRAQYSLPNPILYLGIPCALVKLME